MSPMALESSKSSELNSTPFPHSWQCLPVEIWSMIFAPIVLKDQLRALTLTCKLFCRLVQPRLVQSFTVTPQSSVSQPEPLQSLELLEDKSPEDFIPKFAEKGLWSNLGKLVTYYYATAIPSFPQFLAQCPNLQELWFDQSYSEDTPTIPLPLTTVPALRVFEGPLALAEVLVPGRPLRHLSILGFDVDDMRTEVSADGLMQLFAGAIDECAQLESLSVRVCGLPQVLLDDICTKCAKLKALRVVADYAWSDKAAKTVPPSAGYKWLASIQLPKTLEHLQIRIVEEDGDGYDDADDSYSGDEADDEEADTDASDMKSLLGPHLERYPNLRYVYFGDFEPVLHFNPADGIHLDKVVTYNQWLKELEEMNDFIPVN